MVNVRKIIELLNYVKSIAMAYSVFFSPEVFIVIALACYSVIIFIELVYYSYEYFILLKRKKIFVLETRSNFWATDSILNLLFFIGIMLGVIKNFDAIDFTNTTGFLFTTIASLQPVVYSGLKRNPSLSAKVILFGEPFKKDIWLHEIKQASINEENKEMNLVVKHNKMEKLRFQKKFFKDQYDRLFKIVKMFNREAK